jgi:zinc transporter
LLTFATVMLLPFNVIGGLFGMNVGGIPFANDKEGFWVIIVIVTVLTVALGRLLLLRFRR